MERSFKALGLNDELIIGLEKQGITIPTKIQSEMIPYILDNKDVIGESQTGSGKTLAYLLPIFQNTDVEKKEMQCIILAPTHELVVQIEKEIRKLAEDSAIKLRSTSIMGNMNIDRQIERLKEKPHIIVGSPGRVFELIKKKKISAHTIKTIVIDEGDRLLDKNNIEEVKSVIKTTLRDRQLVLVSATVSEKIKSEASDIMKEAMMLRVKEDLSVSETISHWYFEGDKREKADLLRKVLHAVKPTRAIVFVNRGEDLQLLNDKLKFHKIDCFALFGAANKDERKNALEAFRSGKMKLLLASDIAARGLDIKGVSHIINFDLPEKTADYLHRTGRTGRNGERGIAISLLVDTEAETLKRFSREAGFKIEFKELDHGEVFTLELVK